MESGQPSITKPKRPRGISVIGILGIIGGIVCPLAGLYYIVASSTVANLPNNMGTNSILSSPLFYYAFGGFLVVDGVVGFIISIGMLRGRKWAWKTSIVFYLVIGIIDGIVRILLSQNLSTIVEIGFGEGITALYIYYFYRPRVKSYFGIGTPTTVL